MARAAGVVFLVNRLAASNTEVSERPAAERLLNLLAAAYNDLPP